MFSEELVSQVAREMKVADLQNATIGDVLLVASRLEELTGIPFIRMDQGSPGLPANKVGIEAEKKALDAGLGAQYPAAAGVPELKDAASRFIKALSISTYPRGRVCLQRGRWQLRSERSLHAPSACRERTKCFSLIRAFPSRNRSCAYWA